MAWPKGMKRNRDLRPIRNPEEQDIPKAAEVAVIEQKAEQATEPISVKSNGKSKYLPYQGKESLPAYTINRGRVIPGEPRYALVQAHGKRYKLLAFRRKPSGVQRKLVRTLTSSPADKPLLETLKKAGISGVF